MAVFERFLPEEDIFKRPFIATLLTPGRSTRSHLKAILWGKLAESIQQKVMDQLHFRWSDFEEYTAKVFKTARKLQFDKEK